MPEHTHIPTHPTLILFIGLQASGKSSFYQTYLSELTLISKDLLRNNKRPQRRQMKLLDEALAQGLSVVVDNTNPTPQDRAALIDKANQYEVPVIGYYFASKLSDCLARNNQREGRAKVPDVALYTTAKALQRPTYNEGFDQLYHVTMDPERQGFIIAPWDDETSTNEEKSTD